MMNNEIESSKKKVSLQTIQRNGYTYVFSLNAQSDSQSL